MMMRFSFFLIAFLILLGCGGTFKPPDETKPEEEKTSKLTKDKYEPLGLREDLIVVPDIYAMKLTADSAGTDIFPGTADRPNSIISDSLGDQIYRIQLFTSKEYGPASREADIAAEVFGREVTMDYEVPYYKVRAGRFATLDEAEVYLQAAREAGYTTAWVVKTNVNVKTLEEIYDVETMPPVDTLNIPEPEADTTDEIIEYPEY